MLVWVGHSCPTAFDFDLDSAATGTTHVGRAASKAAPGEAEGSGERSKRKSHHHRMLNFANPGGRMLRQLCIATLALLTIPAAAQSPDIPEPGSTEAIAAATTDPHFGSPWVSYIPQSTSVPSPEKFFDRIMGAPGELVGTEKTYAYARALATASPRVRVFTIGHSRRRPRNPAARDRRRRRHPRPRKI